MALPILSIGSIVRMKFWGGDTVVHDLLNVQWYTYFGGASPQPGGLSIGDVASNAGYSWGNFWKGYQSNKFTWESTTINVIGSFAALGGSKFRAGILSQWTVPQSITGQEVTDMLPSYCAYGIRKISPHPGRGGNGQVRVSGVPLTYVEGDTLIPAKHTLVQDALDAMLPFPLALKVGTGAYTDYLLAGTIDGKLINTDPLHVPDYYFLGFEGAVLSPYVRTQITREVGRRRNHP